MSSSYPGSSRVSRAPGPIRYRTCFRNTIADVMHRRGWKEIEPQASEIEGWDFHWADREWIFDNLDSVHLHGWQRVNHFRNCRELCRKDLLGKNIKRRQRLIEKDASVEHAASCDFLPTTFVLPGDYALFKEEFKRAPSTWVMKPIGKAQGKGIFIINKLAQIAQWKSDYRWRPENKDVEAYVVQRYISQPYLIGGRKFDCRMYALVTSFSPLQVWMYRSGFARFSASRYSNDPAHLSNAYVHLTNVAVQKHSEHYNADTGCKWDLRKLKLYMMARHGRGPVDAMFNAVENIVVQSLLSVQPSLIADKHCFELYGYDILFDADLKPWLIELTANTREDYDMKFKMLSDTLDVVDMEGVRTGEERTIGGFDLIWDDGPVPSPRDCVWTSMIGTDFDKRLRSHAAPQRGLESGPAGAAAVAAATAATSTPTI